MMSSYDLVVRGGTVVTLAGAAQGDVAVADGVIAAVEPLVEGAARAEADARGLHVLPGVVDAHVHLNDPGRADWEGFASGTRALAARGTTCFFDMPLNSHPPTVDGEAFDLKVEAARGAALVDFALWGGLVPGSVDRLDELADRGVIGFKAFLSPSGIDDFEAADDLTLYEGMARAARLGLPVAVHAENGEITSILEAAIDLRRRGLDEFHGFAVAKEIKEQEDARTLTAHGTLYKALDRMEKAGLLESRWEDPHAAAAEGRPRRRLYRVTGLGEQAVAVAHAVRRAPAFRPEGGLARS